MLKTSDFYFDLPQEQIAQTPIEPRDHSRMLHLFRETGELEHRHFYDLPDYLEAGDTLVINTSRVIPARLFGVKEGTRPGICSSSCSTRRRRTSGRSW